VIDAREDVPTRLRELNDGRLADRVLICTGAIPAFKQAIQSIDGGGTILYFAPTEPGIELPIPVNDFWRNGITILPSYGGAPVDIMQAIELIRARRIPVNDMITHRLPLSEAERGFQLVAGAGESVKVILEPQK
jgi:L-iditol 2-dehydrogenase